MEKRFNLKIEDVLDKQFNVDFKGYAPAEVDEFLDQVIQDYQSYEAMIHELGLTLQKYEQTIETLKAKNQEMAMASSRNDDKMVAVSNVDILKRLSKLEAEVFRK